MMYSDNFYKNFIQNSINPFILFNNSGKLVDFNKEAEFLRIDIKPKEIYELAISNAPKYYGFNHKYINLSYGKFDYYAILVGYVDDELIGIELYKSIDTKIEIAKIENVELVNIFELVEISKDTTLNTDNIEIEEIYDISIPDVKLNINNFLFTLNESFKLFKDCKKLKIHIYIKVGEYEIIKNKKYNTIAIDFSGEKSISLNKTLEDQASKSHVNIFVLDNALKLTFPMIL